MRQVVMTHPGSDHQFLTALDHALAAELAPLGFTSAGKKRLVRAYKGHTIQLEIQRGHGRLLNCFAVNLNADHSTATAMPALTRRVGSWPHSLWNLPTTLLLSPLSHTLFPIFWVALFTDRWWRIPHRAWLQAFSIRKACYAAKQEIELLLSQGEVKAGSEEL
jgi:hypothetical protein